MIKPFYIERGGMNKEKVNDALLKCVRAGARAFEGYSSEFINLCACNYSYFGVDNDGDTYMSDHCGNYGDDAIEITLDQLDDHLGISTKSEVSPKELTKEECVSRLEELGYNVELTEDVRLNVGDIWVDKYNSVLEVIFIEGGCIISIIRFKDGGISPIMYEDKESLMRVFKCIKERACGE